MAQLAKDFALHLDKTDRSTVSMTMSQEDFLTAGTVSVAAGVGFAEFVQSTSGYSLSKEISLEEECTGPPGTIDQLDAEINEYFLRTQEDEDND